MKMKLGLLLLLGMVLTVSGCGMNTNQNMINLLEQKYGEKCTYAKAWGGEGSVGHGFYVSCNSVPDNIFVHSNDNGKTISDNYMDYKYKQDMINYLIDIAKNYYIDVNITLHIPAFSSVDGVTPKMTFNEYIQAPNNIHADIEVNQTDEYLSRSFANKLMELGHYFSLFIVNKNTEKLIYSAQYYDDYNELDFKIYD